MTRLVTAVVFCLYAGVAAAQSSDISGFWEVPFDGRKVPTATLAPGVTQAILSEQAKRDAHAILWCNYLGMPALMDSWRPLDIRQGRREVVIQPEVNATPRHIYLNRDHVPADEFDPTTVGDSVGRWEGNTLVVSTRGFAADRGADSDSRRWIPHRGDALDRAVQAAGERIGVVGYVYVGRRDGVCEAARV